MAGVKCREAKYISASEAWESFKKEYFEGMEELAGGFEAWIIHWLILPLMRYI